MRYELEKVANEAYLKVCYTPRISALTRRTDQGQINKGLEKAFVMKFFGFDYLMLPPKYLQDLKKASLDSLSFNVSFSDVRSHRRK